MVDINSDSDPDSAAMAEAMGFTGFGMQRANKKRKLPTPPAQTGANNAPLGKRRPLNLPQPAFASGEGNAEEIDLEDDDDDGGGNAEEGPGDDDDDDDDEQQPQAGLNALSVTDAPGPGHHHEHHQLPLKPQQQHHAGRAQRHPGGGPGSGPGGWHAATPWWEGTWDPRLVERMVKNPWERLEKQRGLKERGTWPARGGGSGAAAAAGGPAGAGADGDVGVGVVGPLVGGGTEQAAAQTTVS